MPPTIIKRQNSLDIKTPYNADFVAALKQTIPAHKRSWNKPVWTVALDHERDVTSLIMIYYRCAPQVVIDHTNDRITKTIKIEYIGRCKSIDNKPAAANVWVDGGWNAQILETALRAFFEGPRQLVEQLPTYYGLLGIDRESTQDEIKRAYRRMARQWHPDTNRNDPDATDMFKQINEANAILSDPLKRKKYNFMLKVMGNLEQSTSYPRVHLDNEKWGYRAPLKCGLLQVEGIKVFGRLVVDKINSWDDIVDDRGRTMTVSWQMGEDRFRTYWI